MKKGLLAAALLLCLCLCLGVSAGAAEEHEHEWEYGYDEFFHWRKCTVCETEEMGLHGVFDGSEYPQVCAACGATAEEGALIHSWVHHLDVDGEWYLCMHCEILLPGSYHAHRWETLRDEVQHWKRCAQCGYTYDYHWHVASCAKPDQCVDCGMTEKEGAQFYEIRHGERQQRFDRLHHWMECPDCGDREKYDFHHAYCDAPEKCVDCGATEADGITVYELYHDGDTRRGADALRHWETCKRCGKRQNEEFHWANCTHPEQCIICGMKAEEGTVRIAHSLRTEVQDAAHHEVVCLECHQMIYNEPHYSLCLNEGRCSLCGAEWHGPVRHEPGQAADAYKAVDIANHQYVCIRCHETIQEPHEMENGKCVKCGVGQEGPLAPAQYTVEGFAYDGDYISGKLNHVPGTDRLDRLFVRTTLFLGDGSTSISMSYVDDDGEFEVGASGNIVHISLAVTGTSKAVRHDGTWTALGSYEY